MAYLAVDPIVRLFVCSAYQGRMFFLYICATKLEHRRSVAATLAVKLILGQDYMLLDADNVDFFS